MPRVTVTKEYNQEDRERVGQTLRGMRLKRGWSLSKLAEHALLSRHHIIAIELGRVNAPIGTYMRLAHALNLKMEDLFREPDADLHAIIDRKAVLDRVADRVMERLLAGHKEETG